MNNVAKKNKQGQSKKSRLQLRSNKKKNQQDKQLRTTYAMCCQ